MSKPKGEPSRDYSTMPRAEAVRHFGERLEKLKQDIRSMPLSEMFRLVADAIDHGPDGLPPGFALQIARAALAELEARLK